MESAVGLIDWLRLRRDYLKQEVERSGAQLREIRAADPNDPDIPMLKGIRQHNEKQLDDWEKKCKRATDPHASHRLPYQDWEQLWPHSLLRDADFRHLAADPANDPCEHLGTVADVIEGYLSGRTDERIAALHLAFGAHASDCDVAQCMVRGRAIPEEVITRYSEQLRQALSKCPGDGARSERAERVVFDIYGIGCRQIRRLRRGNPDGLRKAGVFWVDGDGNPSPLSR